QRLRGVDAEVVEARIVPLGAEPRTDEPARRKFAATVGHVLAAEHTERKHLLRRELRRESGREVKPDRCAPVVDVAPLYLVVVDALSCHRRPASCGVCTRRPTSN